MTIEELINSKAYKQATIEIAHWRVRENKRMLIRKVISYLHQFGTDRTYYKAYLPELCKKL
jgi:hypothetical protein